MTEAGHDAASEQKVRHDISSAIQENAARLQQELWAHATTVERELRTCANDLQRSLQARFAELEKSYHVANEQRYCASTMCDATPAFPSCDATVPCGSRMTLHSQSMIQQVGVGNLKTLDRDID